VSTFTHRLARRGDLPGIVEIYNSTVASRMVTADTEPVSVASREGWFEEHVPQLHPLWVVELEGEVAAWLSFSSFYGRPAYRRTAELSLYVRQSQRGRGLGAYLMQEALRAAPELDLATLLGFIFAHNAPSLALFRRFGFSPWGELLGVAHLDGQVRDLVIVGRRV
jgi:phosphinothricin acetyltransferase